jgi:hypothetical protein
MVPCPFCKATTTRFVSRNPVDPARDIVTCEQCRSLFYRYQGTPLERPEDPQLIKETPYVQLDRHGTL